ncbi:putative plant SNARE 11 [Nymphaea thermarum]|nr:putative plant SNARE 11 [Nymphaea thermarum]
MSGAKGGPGENGGEGRREAFDPWEEGRRAEDARLPRVALQSQKEFGLEKRRKNEDGARRGPPPDQSSPSLLPFHLFLAIVPAKQSDPLCVFLPLVDLHFLIDRMDSLSGVSGTLAELDGQIADIFRALSNGFQKLEKIKDANRQSRQLEELTGKMRECKRLIKEFDQGIKEEEASYDFETNKMLSEKKQSMVIIYFLRTV